MNNVAKGDNSNEWNIFRQNIVIALHVIEYGPPESLPGLRS